MLSLGNVGNVGGLVASIIGVTISAIILLTFAPTVTAELNQVYLQSVDACVVNGERVDRIVLVGPYTGPNGAHEAWNNATTSPNSWTTLRLDVEGDADCHRANANLSGSSDAPVYTPKGTRLIMDGEYLVAYGTTVNDCSADGWCTASSTLTALAGGSLVQILFGAMGILLPAGALGFLGYYGAMVVKERIGGNTLSVAIGATLSVIIVAAILPEVFVPLDLFYEGLQNPRYLMFQTGIGSLAQVLGNFFGIALVGGLISLGMILWQSSTREGQGGGRAM